MFGVKETSDKDIVSKTIKNTGVCPIIYIPSQKQKLPVADLNQKKLVNTANLMEILDCGKHTAIKIGTSARAKVCIERKLFWNVKLIQQYIDSIAE